MFHFGFFGRLSPFDGAFQTTAAPKMNFEKHTLCASQDLIRAQTHPHLTKGACPSHTNQLRARQDRMPWEQQAKQVQNRFVLGGTQFLIETDETHFWTETDFIQSRTRIDSSVLIPWRGVVPSCVWMRTSGERQDAYSRQVAPHVRYM